MKITSYEVLGKLPDLFTFDNGEKVKTLEDWEKRRKEIYKTAVELQYGEIPPKPEFLEIDPLASVSDERIRIFRIRTGTRKCPVAFTVYAHVPVGKGPFPAVIDGDLCYTCMQTPEISKKFTDHGIMLLKFNRCEIVPDTRDPKRTNNLYETYSDIQFGAIAAWAWGYSRVVDALEILGLADMSSITFTGLSRGGKTAMLAGVLDERASIVNPEATCAGSCSCYRIHMKALREDGSEGRSETLKDIINNFPDWFGPGMKAYEDDEASLPFDSHSLKALIAPRVFFDSQAESDIWSGPVNTYQTSLAALEVWKMYGKAENVLWYWRKGGHDHKPEDFDMLIEVIERETLGTPLKSEKFMKLPFDPPEPIFDWKAPFYG
ncbi:MAG: hypothetical protein E7665_07050 [Ruminococcaceae bacterium]|nr:hypothetical protein [Oscillospiraceae bacterium]